MISLLAAPLVIGGGGGPRWMPRSGPALRPQIHLAPQGR